MRSITKQRTIELQLTNVTRPISSCSSDNGTTKFVIINGQESESVRESERKRESEQECVRERTRGNYDDENSNNGKQPN